MSAFASIRTAATQAQPGRANLAALTGARGIAAWFVVLYHIRPGLSAAAHPALMAILGGGYLAVDFFFMLSGFVLWLNYADRLHDGTRRDAAAFLVRRVARIWPLHIAVLAAAIVFAAALEMAGKREPTQYPWDQLPLHVLLVQNWGLTDRLAWNDPAWSISAEWAAYLLFPLLAIAAGRRRASPWVLVVAIAAAAFALHGVLASGGASTLGFDIPRFGLLRALVEFTIGAIVCALWKHFRARSATPTLAATAVTAVGLAILAARGAVPETLSVPLLFAALLLALALTAGIRRNPLSWSPLVYLGQISYATYLIHFLGYIVFKQLFVTDPFAVPLPLVALFCLGTLAASAAAYHWIELPAQSLIRRLATRAPTERTPAPAL